MRFLLSVLGLLVSTLSFGQTISGLIAHYDFDNSQCRAFDATGNAANQGILFDETVTCKCGVSNGAMNFDGIDDYFTVAGSAVLDLFDDENFSLSFYMKSRQSMTVDNQIILSKRSDDCAFTNSFEISYSPSSSFINVLVQEDDQTGGSVNAFVDLNTCWQMITFVREGRTSLLYINGVLKNQFTANQPVDLSNANVLTVAKASCTLFDNNYEGLLDDMRFYNRALTKTEVEELYFYPDKIANSSFSGDTLIFKGSNVPVFLANTCAEDFIWSPTNGICAGCETEATPILSPEETTTYTVSMFDSLGCEAKDTILITVVDPSLLDCTTAFLPKAFTPNFDGLNDTYGIDNPLVIDELLSFEIFDRWGERIFITDDPLERWDGSFLGKEVTAGVYIYTVTYICDEKEYNNTDSFSVIR